MVCRFLFFSSGGTAGWCVDLMCSIGITAILVPPFAPQSKVVWSSLLPQGTGLEICCYKSFSIVHIPNRSQVLNPVFPAGRLVSLLCYQPLFQDNKNYRSKSVKMSSTMRASGPRRRRRRQSICLIKSSQISLTTAAFIHRTGQRWS